MCYFSDHTNPSHVAGYYYTRPIKIKAASSSSAVRGATSQLRQKGVGTPGMLSSVATCIDVGASPPTRKPYGRVSQ